jgi:hypothetical protein
MARYTQEQMARLAVLASDIMMATLLIDRTDRIGVLREFHNGTKFIEEAKRTYPQNALIQNMVSGIVESVNDIQSYTIAQRRATENTYRTRINEAARILVDDSEAKEFKYVLVELAKKVAAAAGHGLFGSGEKVSLAEGEFVLALQRLFHVA